MRDVSQAQREPLIGTRPDFCRIALVGDNGSGKTTLLTRFIFNTFNPSPPLARPRFNPGYRKQILVDGHPCILELVEAEPREGTQEFLKNSIKNADAVIIAYSICGLRWHPHHQENERDPFRRDPLDAVVRFHELVRRTRAELDELMQDLSIVVLGCQKDSEELKVVSSAQGKACADELGCGFSEVSAREGVDGIERCVFELVRGIRESRMERKGIRGGEVGMLSGGRLNAVLHK